MAAGPGGVVRTVMTPISDSTPIGESISRPPTAFDIAADRAFRALAMGLAWAVVLVVFLVVGEIGQKAIPAVRDYGTSFLTQTVWDPNRAAFGILPQIWGTLYTSVLGLAIGAVFGIAIAIFLSEGFLASAA